MTLVRWEPIRLFNTFFDTPTTGNGGCNALRRWIPATDLVETDDHFVLKADLPGLTRLADRLEREGLIRRESSSDDARGAYAVLTPAGAQ